MRQRKRLLHDFVLLLSQPESIGSSKFLCLPPIIRGILWGVDTRILKICCFLAEIEAKQNHAGDVIAASPFSGDEPSKYIQFSSPKEPLGEKKLCTKCLKTKGKSEHIVEP